MSNLPPAYILAGGQCRRFGSDKARARLDGQPLIVRLAEQLQAMDMPATVVADRPEKYADLGLYGIADDQPGCGPLAGLQTALKHRKMGWLLLCSCDLLEVRAEWVQQLWDQCSARVSAVAFKPNRWEPFPGLYHTNLLPQVEAHLDCGQLSIQRLLNNANARAIEWPCDWPHVVQANTPTELDWYEQQSS